MHHARNPIPMINTEQSKICRMRHSHEWYKKDRQKTTPKENVENVSKEKLWIIQT